jgi:CHASE3 domain sensor protein
MLLPSAIASQRPSSNQQQHGHESSCLWFALTGKESYVESYHAGIGRAAQAETTIRNLTVDNAAQQRRLPALEKLMAEKIQFGEAAIALRRTTRLNATADVIQQVY